MHGYGYAGANLHDVFDQSLELHPGEKKTFHLREIPEGQALTRLMQKLYAVTGYRFSYGKNDLEVSVFCTDLEVTNE